MALRGTPARRLVGNPLGGVLRGLDQRTRIAGRNRVSGAREQDPAPSTIESAARPAQCSGVVVTTCGDGRAQWVFPAPFGSTPVVSAVAVDPDPEDDERTVWVTVEEVTTWCVTVRVWRSRPRRGAGVATPAGEGLIVHVAAVAQS